MSKEEKKKSPLRRGAAFLLTLALVLTAVFLVANWQKLNFDYIRRYFAYRTLERNEDGQVESFEYDGGVNCTFARMGGDLLVCSKSGVRLYSSGGTEYVNQTRTLSNPVVSTGGACALVYDAGGSSLYVYRDREEVFSYTTDAGQSILSASLSAQGTLVIATQASGVKGSVTVYDSDFQPLLGLNISSRFITDAILSPDGRTLALATSGQTRGSYDSQIAFYRMDSLLSIAGGEPKPDALCSLGNNTILKLNWTSEPLRILGENALVLLNTDGSEAGSYSYNWRHLKGYSLDGDGQCILLLGRYRAGTEADLVAVDLKGEETASLSMDRQILSLSTAGRYLSVLTVDDLTIYTGDLEAYHITEDLQGARKVLQNADGSVTLIAGETARLYLPD
ncbi:MAG: hypothetical protein J6J87_09880 [Oscillospiraceae bacterium]|nr:hypothetical protein [Oscillospiraceae bacterium]